MARAKADPFAAHVAASAKSAQSSSKAMQSALGALVTKRLQSRQRPTVASQRQTAQQAMAAMPRSIRQRRSARRIGRDKAYTPTTKPDISRFGTFRHYMIALIRRHSSTRAAELEHATCDNAKWAKNKLDFNWAADNGFINWA